MISLLHYCLEKGDDMGYREWERNNDETKTNKSYPFKFVKFVIFVIFIYKMPMTKFENLQSEFWKLIKFCHLIRRYFL